MNRTVLKGTLKFPPRLFPSGKGASFVVEAQAEGRQYPDSVTVTAFEELVPSIKQAREGDYVRVQARIAERKTDRINERTGKPLYETQVIAERFEMGA